MSVGFHLNLTFGLKPEVGVFKIVTNCLQTIHFPSWVAHSHFDLFYARVLYMDYKMATKLLSVSRLYEHI